MGVKHGPSFYGKNTRIRVRDRTTTLLVSINILHKIFTLQNQKLQETGFQYALTHPFDNRASPEERVVIYIQTYFGKHNKE
jgi:hypothetical protein